MESKRARIDNGFSLNQKIAFAKVKAGDSIFITGSAGTGKSYLLKKIVEEWTRADKNFAVTATTGIAALGIGGRTFHSFAWLTVDDDDESVTASDIYNRLKKKPSLFKFYTRIMCALECLIIDEVSMMNADLLKKTSDVFKLIRSNGRPFGGIQIVMGGDFFQLPTVSSKTKFLFQSPFFYECIQDMVILDQVFRQNDASFVALLGRMRTASLNADDIAVLTARVNADITKFGIEPTQLYSTNKDVDRINQDKLSQIKSPDVSFERFTGITSKDMTPESRKNNLEKFERDIGHSAPKQILLRGPPDSASGPEIGAQIMLTFNLNQEQGLVNGSRGVIIGFREPHEDLKAHPKSVLETDNEILNVAYIRGLKMPLVRFLVNGSPLETLVPYVKITRKITDSKKSWAYAWFMPLKLAWATTVHKSQGQSLDCVRANLDSTIFEEGQAYVAVSRARTLDGLTLTAFDPKIVKANSQVIEFYSTEFYASREKYCNNS
jgi:ATP-dependent DNA helicase PIF1